MNHTDIVLFDKLQYSQICLHCSLLPNFWRVMYRPTQRKYQF